MTLAPEDRDRLDRLAEKAEAKRAADFAKRKAASDELLARSAARLEASIAGRINSYFKDKYGARWREKKERLSR